MTKSHSTICIPEIYHAFKSDKGDTYILMEKIDIETLASDEQRAQAISELISVIPPSGTFGSIGGGLIKHNFFRVTSVMELEAYINRVCYLFTLRLNIYITQ